MPHPPFNILALAGFVHQHLLWFLLAAYALAALFPGPGMWMRTASFGRFSIIGASFDLSLVLMLLATMMFNAGLGVKLTHMRALRRKARLLIAGLAANLVVPVLYVFGVMQLLRFWHNPEEAQHVLVGLALIASMPIAGSSTAWAQNSNGNLALSLGLVLCSTLLSPFVTPAGFYVFGEMASQEYETVLRNLAHYGSSAFLGVWVVLPVMLGFAARTLMSDDVLKAMMPVVKFINAVVLLLLNYSNASVSLPRALADHDLDFLALSFAITSTLCVTAFGAAYGIGKMLRADEPDRVSLVYGLGMNNNGTGLVLASLALSSFPRVMVAVILYNLTQHVVAGAVHECLIRRAREAESGNDGERVPIRGSSDRHASAIATEIRQ
ncbi:MAG TPA: bile acid:sodium symporter [Nitrospira sp.]|nr:bile acid:sodium symporter [Nitrospira sp.]